MCWMRCTTQGCVMPSRTTHSGLPSHSCTSMVGVAGGMHAPLLLEAMPAEATGTKVMLLMQFSFVKPRRLPPRAVTERHSGCLHFACSLILNLHLYHIP
jgi:hypothetical protein